MKQTLNLGLEITLYIYIYQMNELYSLYCFAIDAYVTSDLVNVYFIITFEHAIQLFDEMPV